MYYYRAVGLHDGLVYIEAGRYIAMGENPYTSGVSRSGTVTSLLLYFVYVLMPNSFEAPLFQVINLFCVGWFIWTIRDKRIPLETFLLAVLVAFWISPVREMLAINQVNAFLAALLGTVFYLSSSTKFENLKSKTALMGICFALAIDLKPHLLLVTLIVWSIIMNRLTLIAWTAGIFIGLHLIIDIYVGAFTELDWLNRVGAIEDSASTTELGDSVTVWPIFNMIFPNMVQYVPVISLTVFLAVAMCAIGFALGGRHNLALILSLVAPAFYIYFHFYDMIPLALIFIVNLLQAKSPFPYIAILPLLLIPKEFTNPRNLLLVFVLTLLVWRRANVPNERPLNLVFTFILYATICILNSHLFGEPRITQSIFVTELLLLLTWGSVRIKSRPQFLTRK